MQLRRLAVAVLAAGIPLIGFAAPAGAASYPPGVPTQQKTVASGVVYGGSAAGSTAINTCSGSMSARIAAGAPFTIKVCGWIPGTGVTVSVKPPHGASATIDTLPADGDGAVTVGPLRLSAPGSYIFRFKGLRGTVEGLGVGGVGSRGLSRVAAAPVDLAVTLTVPADGTLPKTGSDSSGPSTAIWGGGLLLLGALILLVVRARRRRTPGAAAVSTP